MAAPFHCPHCGAPVPPRARACPVCGSDEETGWSEQAEAQRLGLPDEAFDYDEFVREEFGSPTDPPSLRPPGITRFWWAVAVLILVALLLLWVF